MSTKLPIIDLTGKAAGEVSVPAEIFTVEPNESVIHFVCEGQRFRHYNKTAVTKTRAAVNGGGKKNRKQKGTGGARQGGNRAPHWVGGGVVFGPNGMQREFKVNRKLYKVALAGVLSDRFSSGQIRVLKSEGLKAPKTKSVVTLLEALSLSGARVGFVVKRGQDDALAKSVRNIKGVDLLPEEHWTTLDFIKTDSLIFSTSALEGLTAKFETKAQG